MKYTHDLKMERSRAIAIFLKSVEPNSTDVCLMHAFAGIAVTTLVVGERRTITS